MRRATVRRPRVFVSLVAADELAALSVTRGKVVTVFGTYTLSGGEWTCVTPDGSVTKVKTAIFGCVDVIDEQAPALWPSLLQSADASDRPGAKTSGRARRARTTAWTRLRSMRGAR